MTVSIIPSLRLSTTKNGTHGGGVEYTDGVTVFGQSVLKEVMLNLKPFTDHTLYYYCTTHSGMGGQINTLT